MVACCRISKGGRPMNKSRVWLLVSALLMVAMLLNACGSASGTQVAAPTSAPATAAVAEAPTSIPATAAVAEAPTQASANPAASGPTCGTDPITLNAYFETG